MRENSTDFLNRQLGGDDFAGDARKIITTKHRGYNKYRYLQAQGRKHQSNKKGE